MPFQIHRIDRHRAQQVEPLGSKPKFWFMEGDRRFLFKAEDRGTGEDWAEVITCHLAQLLGIPHVQYELAAEYDDKAFLRPGVICENMAQAPKSLILGNQLLLALDSNYPISQRFKVRQHSVDVVCEILSVLQPPTASWMTSIPRGITTAIDVFTGYVMLDAWVANQDRHHENWGAIWDGAEGQPLTLAPTFDHGASLARNLQDTERQERLTTQDQSRSITAFVARGRSAFYGSPGDSRPLLLLEAFREFAAKTVMAARNWLDRLRAVSETDVSTILDEVPTERFSGISKDFTLELLISNRQRLLDLEICE